MYVFIFYLLHNIALSCCSVGGHDIHYTFQWRKKNYPLRHWSTLYSFEIIVVLTIECYEKSISNKGPIFLLFLPYQSLHPNIIQNIGSLFKQNT